MEKHQTAPGFRQMRTWRKVLFILAVILTLSAVWFTSVVWSMTPGLSGSGEPTHLAGWVVSVLVIGFMTFVQDGFLLLIAGAGLTISAINIWARVTWVRVVSIILTAADGLCALSAIVHFLITML